METGGMGNYSQMSGGAGPQGQAPPYGMSQQQRLQHMQQRQQLMAMQQQQQHVSEDINRFAHFSTC